MGTRIDETHPDALEQAALKGMVVALVAARSPDKLAVWVAIWRSDLRPAQCTGQSAGAAVTRARHRGWRVDCGRVEKPPRVRRGVPRRTSHRIALHTVNFHLTAEEIGYVVDDCEADVVIFDGSLSTAPMRSRMRRARDCG